MAFADMLQRRNQKQLSSAAALLALTAFSSYVFLLNLAPVYGSAPSHIFHGYGVAIVAAAGWFLKDRIQQLSARRAVYLLPVMAAWIPTIQYLLFQQSSQLGNPTGPIVTTAIAFYPFLLLSVACAGKLMQSGLNLDRHGELVAEHGPLLASYVVYSAGEHLAKAFTSATLGVTFFLSRTGLQLLIAGLYSAVVPSKLLVLAIPSILFSFTSNVHLPMGRTTTAMDSAIRTEGFGLVARQDSSTGYISVLDNLEDGFRVMRCDHSLLGGQWTKVYRNYKPAVKDPIYAVFTMLEAVRLVEPDSGVPRVDADSKALVIGLGVGTTPAALITHGIETTVVEIDPIVHKFALEYFDLPTNHIAAIEDATVFVRRAQESSPAQYDYIVHDVFTGGAEPVDLFTIEFLQGLNALLKDDGVIAINYAGDVSEYPAALTVRTIEAVFPSCRIFREEVGNSETADFTNMVIFCKKSPAPLTFRDPVPGDYLRSKFRETYLMPKHEVDPSAFMSVREGGRAVLRAKETGRLHKWQDQGALQHWAIMRKVLPDAVWENW
ncbi:S-adenosyl-L-methionine-dependent methyltransferase [Aspergillus steynii IBT 23096]|uniref:S-adenosyl-L-methionine-dependent methyltransferase n=1 Tax=Aspergillus steynii IBT 23096 TaxID=1392250 RepID=A0A2I2FZ04_9EURO|nr:S-adenosyl-L-methionine-dependent methyltransferase [Aspergillus steynii IBT 23096]PLB45855.1 S-adenosyl-L-methionine-dependent methyltransferase [Aspergillus steynii IBT 23096]